MHQHGLLMLGSMRLLFHEPSLAVTISINLGVELLHHAWLAGGVAGASLVAASVAKTGRAGVGAAGVVAGRAGAGGVGAVCTETWLATEARQDNM